MADPPSADRFLAALRAEGVNVVEVGAWRTHNRNHKGPWGPIHGVMIHHTVSKGSAYTVSLCRDGYAELPGPLCHGVITKDGRVHLVGYGRTNHAGGGDPDTLAAVIAEDYGTRPPVPNVGNADGIDGNRHFYGFECENLGDGNDPWPAPQLDAIERVSAAICRLMGWTAKSVIGHLEWSDDKSDPRGFSMTGMRDRIAARLRGATTPPTPEEDDMPTAQEIAEAVWRHTETNAATGRPVYMGAVMAWMDRVHNTQTDTILRQLTAQQAAITALATQLGQAEGVDTATVVAAVERAIAEAVIDVNVNVTSAPTTG
ncbi:N-acetylmuramoyl-L-alanine amidase [Streptomyces sp. PCS3-D2]|uniref:peptidoglycan recognition protein family protein n=1 Tax=Streptomyces sp. PCS3-D2 TaxID=1460244 RepID=UPI000448A353|nr:N-acetylmuramoyl-L-alanine amidase [Streptomyces sp. PCS3-D2]WKV74715.1 N-acetylmuramoyl-L-alanine amidase [Streptomyces sp. PCS3-D2]